MSTGSSPVAFCVVPTSRPRFLDSNWSCHILLATVRISFLVGSPISLSTRWSTQSWVSECDGTILRLVLIATNHAWAQAYWCSVIVLTEFRGQKEAIYVRAIAWAHTQSSPKLCTHLANRNEITHGQFVHWRLLVFEDFTDFIFEFLNRLRSIGVDLFRWQLPK